MSWASVTATSASSLASALIGATSAYVALGRNILAGQRAADRKQSTDAAKAALAAVAEFEISYKQWRGDRDRHRLEKLSVASMSLSRSAAIDALLILDEQISEQVKRLAILVEEYADGTRHQIPTFEGREPELTNAIDTATEALRMHIIGFQH